MLDATPQPIRMPKHYRQRRVQGKRLPGWDDLNTRKLAEDLGMDVQHVRETLTGRRNATTIVLKRIAKQLAITTAQLMQRIEYADTLDDRESKRANEYRSKLK